MCVSFQVLIAVRKLVAEQARVLPAAAEPPSKRRKTGPAPDSDEYQDLCSDGESETEDDEVDLYISLNAGKVKSHLSGGKKG